MKATQATVVKYRNTRETVGTVVEVTSSLKLRSNMRLVNVPLNKQDRRLLEEIEFFEAESYDSTESFRPLDAYLKVQVMSDTFGGGIVGKLLNLKEVHASWTKAYEDRHNKGGV